MKTGPCPQVTAMLPLTLIVFVLLLVAKAFAGPPYITDDPKGANQLQGYFAYQLTFGP